MVEGLLLIRGQNLEKRNLMISLSNAKQLIVGRVHTLGFIVHIAASTQEDFYAAFLRFSAIPKVKDTLPLLVSKGG
ncbi:hypothetical protein [Algoriphagus antarcticus]|uniref:Uncharacterized protein n=1 Tax=Algoriphagus antarcticus TaxID=238540 RepID=A0A3E0E065_9BACT|nr:hypothetical protein [Algoriphagus antarcticus]REG90266.1 hypothetical protein C8N25_1073 [Algoriphagus antarcticus]